METQAEPPRPSNAELEQAVASARAAVAQPQKKDPLIQILVVTILMVIVLALVTGVYAYVTGVFGNGAPRTYTEDRILSTRAKVDAGSKAPAEWNAYILALIEDGQYGKAQEMIDKGSKLLPDQDIGADMLYMQASLDFAQGNDGEAMKEADAAIKVIKARYEEGKKNQKETGNPDPAFSAGLNDNYYELLLLKAEVFEKRKDWKNAVKAYDAYLADKPTAATVFTDRANAKATIGDKAGAEKDYRATLMFIPDDEAALAGLKRIGAAQ